MEPAKPESLQRSGRTQWDVIAEIVQLLGKAAPYAVVLALIIFGVYKYIQLYQEAFTASSKQYQDQVNRANEQLYSATQRLIETYAAIGGITSTQMKNLNDSLGLHEQTNERIKKLRESEESLRNQLERLEKDLASQKKQ